MHAKRQFPYTDNRFSILNNFLIVALNELFLLNISVWFPHMWTILLFLGNIYYVKFKTFASILQKWNFDHRYIDTLLKFPSHFYINSRVTSKSRLNNSIEPQRVKYILNSYYITFQKGSVHKRRHHSGRGGFA